MKILATAARMSAASQQIRSANKVLGLAPTMGALHAGHLSLIRAARSQCDVVAASIFVNPTQFAPNEDFSRYPRPFDEDISLLQAEGVDFLFAPSVDEIYPAGASTFVVVEGLSDKLDGTSRPGHFRGVATVVAKLFNVVQPQRAYFGQKDAAQVAVLRKMVRDLAFAVELVVCPIVREPDGLAMSSRNRYLSPPERQQAQALSRALQQAGDAISNGETSAAALKDAMLRTLSTDANLCIDYVAIVDPDTLEPVDNVRNGALLAVAAYVGTTRLIDNLLIA